MKLRFSGISWGRASFPGSDSLSLSSSSFDLGFFPQKKVTPSEKHHLKNLVFFLVGDFFTSFCTMEKKPSNHHLRELYAFIYIYIINWYTYIYIYIRGLDPKVFGHPIWAGSFFLELPLHQRDQPSPTHFFWSFSHGSHGSCWKKACFFFKPPNQIVSF